LLRRATFYRLVTSFILSLFCLSGLATVEKSRATVGIATLIDNRVKGGIDSDIPVYFGGSEILANKRRAEDKTVLEQTPDYCETVPNSL
jgi:hypothetical protein